MADSVIRLFLPFSLISQYFRSTRFARLAQLFSILPAVLLGTRDERQNLPPPRFLRMNQLRFKSFSSLLLKQSTRWEPLGRQHADMPPPGCHPCDNIVHPLDIAILQDQRDHAALFAPLVDRVRPNQHHGPLPVQNKREVVPRRNSEYFHAACGSDPMDKIM